MERDVVIVPEEIYQRIKKVMNKKDDFFTQDEIKQFTNIYRKN